MVIDGHNDLVLRRWRGDETLHMDLEAGRAAGFAGGFFALYVPSPNPPQRSRSPSAARAARCAAALTPAAGAWSICR